MFELYIGAFNLMFGSNRLLSAFVLARFILEFSPFMFMGLISRIA